MKLTQIAALILGCAVGFGFTACSDAIVDAASTFCSDSSLPCEVASSLTSALTGN